IEDAHAIRTAIRDHKGLKAGSGPITLPGHDMKLGRGGIREIEFFTQTRQLIAGGRDPGLRLRGTVPALAALAEAGWVPEEQAARLTDIYRRHREVEHRLQMLRDAQTHSLPQGDDGLARLAAFMGTDWATLSAGIRDDLEAVHAITEGFFAPDAAPPALRGFPPETVARWHGYPAFRSARAGMLFDRIAPRLEARLAQAVRPEAALLHLDAFLRGLPAGVQVFSLFDANPALVDLIGDVCSVSPALAEYLGRNARVLDAVLDGSFFAPWPGVAALTEDLTAHLAREADHEARLDAARAWGREWHFRIGVHHLRRLIDAPEAGRLYAELAEAVLRGLWPAVVGAFAARHGPPPGRGAALVGMGSLGAGRLHARSDLDLILIYDEAGVDLSDGPRPLPTRAYYARLTQALITALSAPMARGRLYEVDMRLRPSGRNGPVATSLSGFAAYQRDEAWTWEHLALTRARVVAGDPALGAAIEAVRCVVLAAPRDRAATARDVADMRARLAQAKPGQGGLAAKDGPGRLQDVELFAQTLALLAGSDRRDTAGQIAAGVAAGLATAGAGDVLRDQADRLWRVRAVTALTARDDRDTLGEGALALLGAETGLAGRDALEARIEERVAEVDRIVASGLAGWADAATFPPTRREGEA
ncbi:MAG: glutamine-synthetase adenylyltransferase, partial [Shimia sp.]